MNFILFYIVIKIIGIIYINKLEKNDIYNKIILIDSNKNNNIYGGKN